MAEDPVWELRELVGALSNWLRFQGRLGWVGVKEEVEPPAPPRRRQPQSSRQTLKEIREELGDCRRCKLAGTRNLIVFGDGSPQARLMFIGEGPGAEEDVQGLPFVGAAGQLLNNMLSKLGLRREEVYIANVVKCRPPGNREPESDEVAACLPFLAKQIDSLRPRVIVTLGRVATQALLNTQTPLTRLRGQWQHYQHIPVMPTFHPSYLLRLPRERQKTWEDMQLVMEQLTTHADH
jgi:DNA polymerase